MLVPRHVCGGELGDVVLSQSGEDAGLERVVVRDDSDVPHIWRDQWCGVQLRQRSRTSGTLWITVEHVVDLSGRRLEEEFRSSVQANWELGVSEDLG